MGKGSSKFPLSGWEVAVGLAVVVSYGIGLLGVYFSMPPSDYSFLKLPRTLEELQTLSARILTGRMSRRNLINDQQFCSRQGIEVIVNAPMDGDLGVFFDIGSLPFSIFKIYTDSERDKYQIFGIRVMVMMVMIAILKACLSIALIRDEGYAYRKFIVCFGFIYFVKFFEKAFSISL